LGLDDRFGLMHLAQGGNMAKARVDAGGGFASIRYAMRKGREAGGQLKLFRRLRSRNACKTCAFGMGGQRGGMVNEKGGFPEVCKKSIQAVAGDLQAPIPESFFETHTLRDLESWTARELEFAGRLAFPVVSREGDSRFRRVSWDEALDHVAAELKESDPSGTFFYASGRSSNEAAFLLQTFARAYGTANIHNCSFYCHNASGVALSRMVGSGTATVVLDDLDRADLAIVAGANPASNHPRLIVKLVELRKRGGIVIVVNPLREIGLSRFRIPSRPGSLLFGSEVSDLYLQPNVGSDVAVFKAILKALIEREGGLDREFLAAHVEGWEAVEEDARAADRGELLGYCGLRNEEIERAASAIAAAGRGIVLWAMGLTHHEHGTDAVTALCNLALARGWLGKRGCGLMPIRGHSNVQGVGSVGFAPALKEAFARKMEEAYGIGMPDGPGLDTYRSMVASHEGKIRTAVLLGGNLYGSSPDLAWAGEAMRRIGTTAYLTTKLNVGHVHGRGRTNVLLPVLARDEERQRTSQESMFNFVRLSDGGFAPPPGDLRSEVEAVCALAGRVLPPGPFPFETMTDHDAVREAIARVVPGWGAASSGKEFQIRGRTFHRPEFPTPSGKARATVTPLPRFRPGDGEFRLMTLRSEGQFNTVVYEEQDVYRNIAHREVVMMNRGDGKRLDLAEGDPVVVETETGSLGVTVAWADLPAGNLAMYFPEANVLVPRRLDPASGTPAFKSVIARLRKPAAGA
jgi:molybdopterin-dependent oxidoreductase alpha subunit